MNDLRVEIYNPEEVANKKRLISKRAAGGAIVLTLGLFSLTGCDYVRELVNEQTSQVEDRVITPPPPRDWDELPPMPGGSGSWFVSVLERVPT